METTGRMLVGTEIGRGPGRARGDEARRHRHQLRHRPSEMQEHLRHLSRHSRLPDQRAPERRSARASSTAHALRPRAPRTSPRSTPPRRGPRHRHRRRLLRHHARTPGRRRRRCRRSRTGPAVRTTFEPSVTSLYSPVPIVQDNSFLIIGERTNANGSKAFRRRCSRATGTPAPRWPPNRSARARTSSTSVSTTSAATAPRTWTRSRAAVRQSGLGAARPGLHRAAGDGAGLHTSRPCHPQLGEPGGRRTPGTPRPGLLARPRVRRRRDLSAHRRARAGARRRVEDGDRASPAPDRHRAVRVARERPDLRRTLFRCRPATTTCAATPSTRSRRSAGSRRRSRGPSRPSA